jgi:hypothetical protein
MSASFLRAFAPTRPEPPEHLGLQPLATGRNVYRTGKVDIGLRANEVQRARDFGRDATAVQDWILGSEWSSSRSATRKIAQAALEPPARSWWRRLIGGAR